jgi:hypothetical protein
MASAFENITPMGPCEIIFLLSDYLKFLWAVYGDYDASYNPYGLEVTVSVNSVRMDG